ncbi:hypothetical protein PGT21_012784 [Puccinia graminis f. sp. tritici]|uniref:Uncharacterized protein n=2 Tax=Puccinia graminis f. sp. tritici TaxID=56615 RepID=A0A5B0PXG4_PUCGR|nr:hypothetical protein PGT21_012784 [Puccinia graminis f. sp. tritici]KAA1125185.1 hypothetical protein PGTUg99_012041 [Puccinia graminis f. sp. tritici]
MTNIDPSLPTNNNNNSNSTVNSNNNTNNNTNNNNTNHHRKRSRQSSSEDLLSTDHDLSSLDPTLSAINDSMAADTANLLNHHSQHTPKRKRDSSDQLRQSDLDHHQDNNSNNRPSLDTLQLAHLITSIQAHQQPPSSSVPIEPSSSSHLAGYNILPDYLLPSEPTIEPEWKEKFEIVLNPLKLEISRLRSRIEILEDERLVMAREITSLKGSHNIPSDLPPRSFPGSTHQIPLPAARDNPRLTTILGNSTLHNHALDIPVGPLPEIGSSSQAHSTAGLNHQLAASASSGTKPVIPQSVINSSSKFETGTSFRRQSTRKKSEAPSSFNTSPASNATQASNNRSKHRKPELSRTVRATVFRLMGVSSSQSPVPSEAGLPSETCSKFGNEKSRAYHGYTTSPCFPEYTPDELYDPVTKARIWRWDWSKTIRQSQNNTNFAKEIRNVIAREAADPIRPMHTEVPSSDWLYLDDAIDSAYTNMRRERENLIDPTKMVKKEVHRARNKKRGLKEDKYKRRRKALDEYRADPQSFGQRLREANLRMTEKPIPGDGLVGEEEQSGRGQRSGETEDGAGRAATAAEEERWDDALDIKYMSSEDEGHVNDFENPIGIGTEKTDNTLAASDKVFAICRPTWRSDQLHNLFSVLDIIKQPERAYRRVLGPYRDTRPPLGTPSWMINPACEASNPLGPSASSSSTTATSAAVAAPSNSRPLPLPSTSTSASAAAAASDTALVNLDASLTAQKT